jgi:hypothetical protein
MAIRTLTSTRGPSRSRTQAAIIGETDCASSEGIASRPITTA